MDLSDGLVVVAIVIITWMILAMHMRDPDCPKCGSCPCEPGNKCRVCRKCPGCKTCPRCPVCMAMGY